LISEIIVTSKYIVNGYEVNFELRNKRIRKLGWEGQFDLAVKFNDKWIYFEITREQKMVCVVR
jgi:hypothetical protein